MDNDYKISSPEDIHQAETIAENKGVNVDESKEAQIIEQIDEIYINFNNNLQNSFEFIYNVCRVDSKHIHDSLKMYNFADLIFNSIQGLFDSNLLPLALSSLAIFLQMFPEYINPDFLLFATNSIIQIQEISPATLPLISSYISLVNSLLTEPNSVFFIHQDFLSNLSGFFLFPEAEGTSISILKITQKIIFFIANIDNENNQEKAQIIDKIYSDIVKLAMDLIMNENTTDLTAERTNLLYKLLEDPNFLGDDDAQAALESILRYDNPAVKEIFDIFAIWKDFDSLLDVIVISAHDCLKTAMLDDSIDLRIAAMKMMIEFIKKDKDGFKGQFLSYMPEEFLKNLINIIFNGSVSELSVAGSVLAAIIKNFPELFENPLYWLLSESRDNECFNILLAIDKVSGGVEKLTSDLLLGLEFIGSHLRQNQQNYDLFIQQLIDMGIKEMILEKMDEEDFDSELLEYIVEDLFGTNETD